MNLETPQNGEERMALDVEKQMLYSELVSTQLVECSRCVNCINMVLGTILDELKLIQDFRFNEPVNCIKKVVETAFNESGILQESHLKISNLISDIGGVK